MWVSLISKLTLLDFALLKPLITANPREPPPLYSCEYVSYALVFMPPIISDTYLFDAFRLEIHAIMCVTLRRAPKFKGAECDCLWSETLQVEGAYQHRSVECLRHASIVQVNVCHCETENKRQVGAVGGIGCRCTFAWSSYELQERVLHRSRTVTKLYGCCNLLSPQTSWNGGFFWVTHSFPRTRT